MQDKISKSEQEWKEKLTPEQYHVLREKGTERAFTGTYNNSKKHGTYCCAGCGTELFESNTKFDSGSGWPSFFEAISPENVELETDMSHGMVRVEVMCAKCGGHLGHVFNDGPAPSGKRFCINSASLNLNENND
ncbi:Peptide methionine sulfoxide reductase MsrB [Poriferisphaera corsica]|uniref:Peptide methionine sulfoxide reductase MsrB n=1 Tax=Poriferisphaera corsica TaxID=2528020 RepID=A0A517YX87_9BACT|nr:peptide-methionine (R)-S-oxide reductase MsrB [Poriferisphaera corsica]QDU34827.1 Peptide methionine sulfoxide reductase MsrB [Poriferisphaera corsica]